MIVLLICVEMLVILKIEVMQNQHELLTSLQQYFHIIILFQVVYSVTPREATQPSARQL